MIFPLHWSSYTRHLFYIYFLIMKPCQRYCVEPLLVVLGATYFWRKFKVSWTHCLVCSWLLWLLCEGNRPVAGGLPLQRVSNAKSVSLPWRYHVTSITHWGRVTHIWVSKLTIIGSDNGLSPGRRQAIIWSNAWILLIGPLGINFNGILIEFNTFSFKKMHLKSRLRNGFYFVSASMC